MCFLPIFASANSLWMDSGNTRNLFADHCARQRGDTVNVIFAQGLTIETRQNVATSPQKFPFMQRLLDGIKHTIGIKATLLPPYTNLDTTYAQGSLQMQVTDVLPNGNLVLEGFRQYKFWDTYKFEIIRGTARPLDINYYNELSSEQLSNMTIEFGTGNSLEEAKSNGLVHKINNILTTY